MSNSNPLPTFIGLETQYPNANGDLLVRRHLDGAASPLMATKALDVIQQLLPHYSNTHSHVHSSAAIMTQALANAHATILAALNAHQDDYTAVFTGSGATACINRLARGLAQARPDKKVVLVSAMEHHANDLPHRQFGNEVHYIQTQGEGAEQGTLCLNSLESLLKEHKGNVNYIAISAVSNVTGIVNPVNQAADLAHQYGAFVLVDAAQSVAHKKTILTLTNKAQEIDFLVFSGHKIYTPMSPGVIVAKKELLSLLPAQDLGGGSVKTVSYYDHKMLTNFPDREQSGTPNIVGAIALASVLKQLNQYGFDSIERHSTTLMLTLVRGLNDIDGIQTYGAETENRIASCAFNHADIDHGLLAAILNDYYGIAVRNECFCAHPYVSSMLKESLWELDLTGIAEDEQENYIDLKRGMVRVSLSLYNSLDDINYFLESINNIVEKISSYRENYITSENGNYIHKNYRLNWQDYVQI